MTFFIDPYKFGSPEGDPYYADTNLILHFDALVSPIYVTNYAANASGEVTVNSGATIQTDVYKFAPGSVALAGPTSYVGLSAWEDYDLNVSQWTWEFWFYPTAGGLRTLVSHGSGGNGWQIFIVGMAAKIDGVDTGTGWDEPTLNAWHFLAVVRDGSELRFYLDGTQVATRTGVGTIQEMGATYGVLMGITSGGDWPFIGYIDDTRFTSGVARYSGSTMTVPTAPFPNF